MTPTERPGPGGGRRPPVTPLLLLLLLLLAPAPGAAQIEPRTDVRRLVVGGRVQLQYTTTSADPDGTPSSRFLLRRARIWTHATVDEWIDAVAQIDFAKGDATARYAFVRLSPSPALRLSFGQFKRAFDVFELTSSSRILVVERDGVIEGVDDCAGVGELCSYSRFTESLELSSLDIGARAEGVLAGGALRYLATLTNGAGGNTLEDNDGKSVSGRLEWLPRPGLTLAANLAVHDFTNPVRGAVEHAPSAALDVEWGSFAGGPHVQAGVLTGSNWKALDAGGEAARYLAVQAITTYRVPTSGSRVTGVEPVARVSWGDPDLDATRDHGVLLTPGLVVHFRGRNKLAANVDLWRPATGADVWSLKLQAYAYF